MENTNKMKWYHYLGFAMGEMGYTIQNTFVASYMVLYLTQTMGINALTIGTMTLVCRIIDAFSDIGFGMIADRTKKNRFGKFKPWYMGSLLPTTAAFIFVFAIPGNIGVGSAAAVLFAYIMYILYGSIFATVNYQWLSVQPAVCTDDPKEKRTMVTWRHIAMAVAGIVVSYMGINLILALGDSPLDRKGFMWAAIIIALMTLVFQAYACFTSKERSTEAKWAQESVTTDNPAEKLKLKDEFKVFKGNKMLWGALIINLFNFMLATATTTITSYYYTYYVGNPAVIGTVMTIACIVGSAFNIIVGPILTQKLGRNALYLMSGALIIICWIVTYLAMKNIVVLTIAQSFFQIGVILFSNIIFRSIPDAVDWGEWKYGVFAPGMVSAAISFFQKLGMGVATFLVTAALTWVGYQEGSFEQTVAAQEGIRLIYPLIPTIFIILSLIGFFIINSVKKEEMLQMRKDLDEKRGRQFDEKNAIV